MYFCIFFEMADLIMRKKILTTSYIDSIAFSRHPSCTFFKFLLIIQQIKFMEWIFGLYCFFKCVLLSQKSHFHISLYNIVETFESKCVNVPDVSEFLPISPFVGMYIKIQCEQADVDKCTKCFLAVHGSNSNIRFNGNLGADEFPIPVILYGKWFTILENILWILVRSGFVRGVATLFMNVARSETIVPLA